MIKYRMVVEAEGKDFTEAVERLLNLGFVLEGALVVKVINYTRGKEHRLYQAMIKKDKNRLLLDNKV